MTLNHIRLLLVLTIVVFFFSCSNTNKQMPGPATPVTDDDTSQARMIGWITKGDETMLLQRIKAVPFFIQGVSGSTITIDTAQKFQSMDGFGYTLTGASAYVMNLMSAEAKSALLTELFGNSENDIAISMLRIGIGATDLNAEVYTYDDMPVGETDINLQHFSLDKDRTDLIPLLKEILAINPSIKIIATPWSPPSWMKDNNSSKGGKLKPEYYDVYARYFVKYIHEMKGEGISIYAITPQNEPLHPENNPSLLMLAEEQAAFIRDHLGPAFQNASLDTKIIIYDHNCDKPEYPLTVLNDAETKKYVDGSAFHLYGGDISAMTQVRNAHPDKNIYFTEQYTSSDGQFAGDLKWHLRNLIIGAPRNWSRTVLEWNLANDVNYGPHTPGGCTTCKGALTIDGSAVKRNVAYYIIAHASAFVPPGSVRVSSSVVGSLPNVAFTTPAGEIGVIVLNDGDKQESFNIKIGDKAAKMNLDAGAAATFVIRQ